MMEDLKNGCLPPTIFQTFESGLLYIPIPSFCDSSKTLWRCYQYIVKHLKKKIVKDPRRLRKFEEREKEFLELYERTKEKEDEIAKKTGQPHPQPFFYFNETSRHNKNLFGRLRDRSYRE